MNGDQAPRNSGTFRTMAEKATDSPWKRWTLICTVIAGSVGASKALTPLLAPLFGFATVNDLKWRTDKILYMEQVAANKEVRIAILESELATAKKQIEEMKIDIREIRAR